MKKLLVILVSMIFIAIAFSTVTSQASPANVDSSHINTGNTSKLLNMENQLKSKGIPLKYASFPAYHTDIKKVGNVIEPSYSSAPAPMGIGFYGTKDVNGHLTGYNLTTSSVMASIQINNLSDFYLLNDGSTSMTFQLNSILTNVTLFGNSNYTFWTQNVAFYSARTHQLEFLDNIWNFSSSAISISSNVFHSYDGHLVAPTFYYDIGPTITVTYPFTLNLYLNSTVVNRDSAVYFNYSINSGNKVTSGSYDQVLFNSTYNQSSSFVAKNPEYLASGTQVTPTGYIPYDFEIMVGGPGGGSTTSMYNINATMNLMYKKSGKYYNVPSAYDVASETGETSEGISVAWHGETAYLSPGPSFVYGMWNISENNVMHDYKGKISPSNAFMFVSEGNNFNADSAAWSPLSLNGTYNFVLPSNQYSAEALMSYHNNEFFTLGSNVNLKYNMHKGIYTPLYAFDNSQLKNISMYGNGTVNNPYVLFNSQRMPVNTLFEEFNDYAFPVFSGVLIMNTNASTVMYKMPSMFIDYNNPAYTLFLSFYGLPSYNFLNYEIYNASNITILKSNDISGYFSYSLSGFPVANLLIWNSTRILVDSNIFNVMDSGILVYKSPNITVWGNYFINAPQTYNSTFYDATDIWGAPLGIAEYSSGDTIYNNYFNVEITAYSPNYSIYSGNPAIYMNRWNISRQPAYMVHYFNGFPLSGSIIYTYYQGGNYWYNFNGTIPYNDYGLIAYGGDYVPLYYSFFYYFFY